MFRLHMTRQLISIRQRIHDTSIAILLFDSHAMRKWFNRGSNPVKNKQPTSLINAFNSVKV